MADQIVYIVYDKPGGVDGLDHTAKGGNIIRAYLDKNDADTFVGLCHGWYEIKAEVHDLEKLAGVVATRITKLELLALVNNVPLLEKRYRETIKKGKARK